MSSKPSTQEIDYTLDYYRAREKAHELMAKAEKTGQYDIATSKLVGDLLKSAEIYALKGSPDAIRRTQLYATEKQFSLDEESRTRIFRRWVRAGINGLEKKEREIQERVRLRFTDDEERALGIGSGAAGGFIAPADEMQAFVEVMKDFSAMRRSASVISTALGTDAPVPTGDETAVEGEQIGESGTLTELDTVFSQVVLKSFKYSSKIIRVSREWLEDAQNGPEVVRRLLGARIGRIQNRMFTTGNGTTQPQGVVTAATLGKTGTGGQVTSVIYDDFVDLIHSVDAAYRGNAIFQMNDATLKAIRKLKDSAGQPIVTQPPGARDSILGYEVRVNPDIAVMGASAKSILFGDFSQYQIRDVQELVLLRLVERYAEFGQVGFIALLRSDGRLLVPAAVRYYQNASS